MLANMKIGKRLGLGFGIVTLIALGLGAVAILAVREMNRSVRELAQEHMPAADHLLGIAESAEFTRGSIRTLMVSGLPAEMRQRQYANIEKARQKMAEELKGYEAIPRTEHEQVLWSELNKSLGELHEANNNSLTYLREIEKTGIADPDLMSRTLAGFISDHHKVISSVALSVQNGKMIEGGEDHTACRAGKWLAGFKPQGEKLTAEVQSFADAHQQFHAGIKKTKQLIRDNKTEEAKVALGAEAASVARLEKLVAMCDEVADSRRKCTELVMGPVAEKVRAVRAKLETLHEENEKNTDEQIRVSERAVKTYGTAAPIAMIVGLVLAVTLSFFAARSVTRPIGQGVEFAKAMAQGDMTRRLEIHRRDEIGELATALNEMAANLQQMMKDLTGGVSTLASSSTELSAISTQMSSGAKQTAGKSATVATAAEEMSSNTASVAAGMEEATTSLSSVATATEEMTATIGEIANNSEKARVITGQASQQAARASDLVKELGQAAQEVGKVTETITSISAQTNLLALNATIEAARAGAAGKGFAVVANEIKELAQQTARATEDIKSKIGGIQSSTAGTVQDIQGITGVIQQVNEIVATIATAIEEQSTVTKDIAGNIAQASAGMKDANHRVAQTASVSQGIAKDIAGVNQASTEMTTGSDQVQVSAGELSRLAEQLKGMVSKFKV